MMNTEGPKLETAVILLAKDRTACTTIADFTTVVVLLIVCLV